MARILVRADATPAMGTGHVMRCLALVEVLRVRGHDCRFAMADVTEAMATRLRGDGLTIAPLPGPAGSAADLAALRGLAEEADAVIVDGYHFGAEYRAGLAASGRVILAWDDDGQAVPLQAALVVNASSAARPEDYAARAPGARLLLGPRYTPLRRDIQTLMGEPEPPARQHLLVSFGGSDPLGLTAPVLRELAPRLEEQIEAVLGGSVTDPAPAEAAAAAWPDRIRLHRDTPLIGPLMRGARLAVSAAGGTLAELAALRTPSILVAVTGVQQGIARLAASHGWCVAIDGRMPEAVPRIVAAVLDLWADDGTLAAMSAAAIGRIDQGGPERIADALEAAMATVSRLEP